jgi:hypothetical protein
MKKKHIWANLIREGYENGGYEELMSDTELSDERKKLIDGVIRSAIASTLKGKKK